MPGFNQGGPLNEGPMTGRGSGRCAIQGQDPTREWTGPGFRRARGTAKMKCQRIRCRENVSEHPGMAATELELETEESLSRRAKILEAELQSIQERIAQRKQQ